MATQSGYRVTLKKRAKRDRDSGRQEKPRKEKIGIPVKKRKVAKKKKDYHSPEAQKGENREGKICERDEIDVEFSPTKKWARKTGLKRSAMKRKRNRMPSVCRRRQKKKGVRAYVNKKGKGSREKGKKSKTSRSSEQRNKKTVVKGRIPLDNHPENLRWGRKTLEGM